MSKRPIATHGVRKDGTEWTTHGDKRGYSWETFEPGNSAALVHGANSPRRIAERAEEVHAELLLHAPYLDQPHFLPSVKRYLDASATEALLQEHVEQVSAEKGTGAVPSRVWEQLTAARRLAHQLGKDLGLTPMGHAKIMQLTAGSRAQADLERLVEKGRQIRERRMAERVVDSE